RGQRLRRDLFAAFRARDLLRFGVHAAAAAAARASALDAGPDRPAGAGLPAGRDVPGEDHRSVAGRGGTLGPRRTHARVQPGGLARLERAPADEPDRVRRGLPVVRGPAGLLPALRAHPADRKDQRQADLRAVAGDAGGRRSGTAVAAVSGAMPATAVA